LALIGSRVPSSPKVFLLTLATLDDLGAIVIIAIFIPRIFRWLALVLPVLRWLV
jgi:NhaA family Na+:H+ antiporter